MQKSGLAHRTAEDRKLEQTAHQCANISAQFIPLAFESFVGLFKLVRDIEAEGKKLHSACLFVALSRLAQSFSVTLMRGRAIMLIAGSAHLRASSKQIKSPYCLVTFEQKPIFSNDEYQVENPIV